MKKNFYGGYIVSIIIFYLYNVYTFLLKTKKKSLPLNQIQLKITKK